MSWKWNKIDGTKNTPDFDKQVLLVEKRGDKHYGMVGSLQSIDGNGCKWAVGLNTISIFDSFFSGMSFPTTDEKKGDNPAFTPTHWIGIELPKD